jgi:predicted secreted Zn-dependent protease
VLEIGGGGGAVKTETRQEVVEEIVRLVKAMKLTDDPTCECHKCQLVRATKKYERLQRN